MSSHHRRPHYNKGNSCNYVCIAFAPSSSLSLLLKYIDVDKYYLQKWPLPTQKLSRAHTHTHTPLPGERSGSSMWPAARLRGPSLPRRRVAVGAAVVAFGQTAVQNVLDVLDDQVDGH
jgi:hypothetical protein